MFTKISSPATSFHINCVGPNGVYLGALTLTTHSKGEYRWDVIPLGVLFHSYDISEIFLSENTMNAIS